MKLPGCIAWILTSCVAGIAAKSSSSSQSRRHHHHHLATNTGIAGRSYVWIPQGAHLRSVPIGSTGKNASVYWTYRPANVQATTAYIIVHGRLRNGNSYWNLMKDTLLSAVQTRTANVSANSIIVAPQFWASALDKGKYLPNELAWLPNGWSGGGNAVHPLNAQVSSIDVLDSLIELFHNTTHYPSLTNIVAVGHGGGAQLLQRHALVGKDSSLPLKYVITNPSSSAYLTKDRPVSEAEVIACPKYNSWRYGLEGYNGTSAESIMSPTDLFSRYVQRNVVNVVAMNDTSDGGDQSCAAMVQGGVARRDRNLSWWKYLNTLANTSEDVASLPGNFSGLPDWSSYVSGGLNHRLVIVPNIRHNPEKVFRSAQGRSALFGSSSSLILPGGRPGALSSSSTSPATETRTQTASTSSSTSQSGEDEQTSIPVTTTSSSTSSVSSIGAVPSSDLGSSPHQQSYHRDKGRSSREERARVMQRAVNIAM